MNEEDQLPHQASKDRKEVKDQKIQEQLQEQKHSESTPQKATKKKRKSKEEQKEALKEKKAIISPSETHQVNQETPAPKKKQPKSNVKAKKDDKPQKTPQATGKRSAKSAKPVVP